MTSLVVAVFVASLVGSLHCAGMCGGVVALCVSGRPVSRERAWTLPLLYNAGRLMTYTLLGAVSGAVGAAIDIGGSAAGLSRFAAAFAGGAMIFIGVVALLQTTGVRLGCLGLPSPLKHVFQRGMHIAQSAPPGARSLIIGWLTGFLPCGWLYAFVVAAAGTASPWLGAVTMAVFWAGTLPVMLGLGLGLHVVTAPLRRHVPKLTAGALILVGVVTVVGRLEIPAYADPAIEVSPAADTVVEHIESLNTADIPCCHDDS